jgi:hypothetical protein
MAASPETVAGTKVAGATSITNSGHEVINGAVATLADDVTSINTATQNALTLADDHKRADRGFWGKIAGGKTTDGGF